MFEVDPNIGLGNRLRDVADTANRNARQSNLNLASLYKWKAHAENLEAQLAEKHIAYVAKMAHAEGYKAMYEAMKTAHPNSPLLADSGKRYKDGDVKSKAHLHYEAAFDRIIREHGITGRGLLRAD